MKVSLVSLMTLGLVLLMNAGGHPAEEAVASDTKIQPAVLEALQQSPEVPVIVSLQPAGTPPDFTFSTMQQNTAARQASVLASLAPGDFTSVRQYSTVPAMAGYVTSSGIAVLEAHPDVAGVGIDLEMEFALDESVPLIGADTVQATGTGGEGVQVAVLDSGIDPAHPDLADSILGEACFFPFQPFYCPDDPAYQGATPDPDHPARDDMGHGTHVSGIITSNGSLAPAGVAPDAGVYAIKIGRPPNTVDMSGALDAMNFMIEANAQGTFSFDFGNMSFGLGLYTSSAECDALWLSMTIAVETLLEQGTVLFAASGNNASTGALAYPACLSSVVAVGATYDADVGTRNWGSCTDTVTDIDKVVCFSNSLGDLDLLAPGAIITSTAVTYPLPIGACLGSPPGSGVADCQGTSMASPHAVGVAALLKQAIPSITPDAIETALKGSGAWVKDERNNVWTPRIDARVAFLTDIAADYDGDGCPNGYEFQTAIGSQASGGLRNPLSEWDYFNPTHDGYNRVDDILAVVDQYHMDDSDGNPGLPPYAPGYNPDTDRTRIGPNPWNLGPPNGQQRIDDVLHAIDQYQHDCGPA